MEINIMELKSKALTTLKEVFGYDSFKEGQEEIIDAILSGQDALGIMPTGAGKSICYQVPALLLDGITIIISPLISLMQDQVKSLNDAGIHAGYVNSSLTEAQISKVFELAKRGTYKLLYIAPERLSSWEFIDFAIESHISMVTIDEAHCISQWGQDFRPSYLKIVEFIDQLPDRPIVSAFTATATREVKEDILCILGLRNPKVVVTGFDRPNLYFRVETIRNKDDYVLKYVNEHASESGIIYCATRKNVDSLCEYLFERGIPVARYHAGMDSELRKQSQEDFVYDKRPIIIATNAFGMGIDKSNVRYVIHYNMPQSMENYYQEAGRAGRDGEDASCILLFSAQDIIINKFLLEKKDFSGVDEENIEALVKRDAKRLHTMEAYCKTTGCLRNYILEYFGESVIAPCDNCGNCHREYKERDMTAAAKWVINCLYETKGRYGMTTVTGILVGANRAKLKQWGADKYKSYGMLKDYSETELKVLINQMLIEGYVYQTEDKFCLLKMGNIEAFGDEGFKMLIKTYETEEAPKKNKTAKRSTDELTTEGFRLYEVLRNLRSKIAREMSIPPYIVFNDKTLVDMSKKAPTEKEKFVDVLGVGLAKLEKYGERFMDEIKGFLADNPGAVTSISTGDADSSDKEGGKDVSNDRSDRSDSSDASKKGKRTRKAKKKTEELQEFYLNPIDAEAFLYSIEYMASEISNELNRITTAEDARKMTATKVIDFFIEKGYVDIEVEEGNVKKIASELGLESGIIVEDRVSYSGVSYQVLKYPMELQRLIVENLIKKL